MNIKICDRTLCRESAFSFKEKIEIARQLEKLSVDTIELSKIENVKTDTLLIRTIASFVKNAVISVNAGMSVQEVENAAIALNTAKKKRIRIEAPVSTVGMEYTCHLKAAKMIELVESLIKKASEYCDDVEFMALDATRAEKDVLLSIIDKAIESGAKIITICDTAAEAMPDEFAEFIGEIVDRLAGRAELAISSNDKNGLAAANAVMAFKKGATAVKAAIGGSEISIETIASIIKNCGNNCGFESNIKYTEQGRILKQINWVLGNNHNDKSVVTVSEVDESGITLDANDTIDDIATAVLKLGYDLSHDDLSKVYEEFLRVASKKNVGAKDLEAIVATVALQVPPTYKLISYIINNGNIISSSAQITLEKDGEKFQGISIGNGPIDAAFLAIEQIIGHHYELDDFQIQSVTEGKQALGSALVKLRQGGKLYSGNGVSTDIMGASIRAYINAVNKIVYEEA